MERWRCIKAVVAPPATTLIFIDADMARSGFPRGVIGKDDGDVANLGHDGIGLVRIALTKATRMNMDISDDFALCLAAMLPELPQAAAIDDYDASCEGVWVNIVVKNKFFDAPWLGFRAEKEGAAFPPAARAAPQLGY